MQTAPSRVDSIGLSSLNQCARQNERAPVVRARRAAIVLARKTGSYRRVFSGDYHCDAFRPAHSGRAEIEQAGSRFLHLPDHVFLTF
jgi:hypothetical protein